jgi:hypothetical protein
MHCINTATQLHQNVKCILKSITRHVISTAKKGNEHVDSIFLEASYIDDLGVAHLRREDEWVNPYNPSFAVAIGSNQDLSFLAARAKTLALLYYITNYATKDEASTYQMVMTAAMMRKTLEQAGQTSNPSNAEQMALEKGMITVNILNHFSPYSI